MELLPEELNERLKEAYAQPGGCREIKFRDIMAAAPLNDIRDAISYLDECSPEKYDKIRTNVHHELDELYPKAMANKISEAEILNLANDITIWFVFEVIEGRETIEVKVN